MESKKKLANLSFYVIYAIFAVIIPLIIGIYVGIGYGVVTFLVLSAVVIVLFGDQDCFHKDDEDAN